MRPPDPPRDREPSFEPRYVPTKQEIDELIDRARAHPLGTSFLAHGALDAVAAMFQVHAFTVERARDSLGTERPA